MVTEKSIEAYPLSWPPGFPRTRIPKRHAQFDQVLTFGRARDQMIEELKRLRATDIVISSNIPLRKDGIPTADFQRRIIKDHGVAVYFRMKDKPRVLACDRWDRIEHNVRAITLTVEALRGLDRWGASDILERAFMGLTALPAPEQWWDILGVPPQQDIAVIEAVYKSKMRQAHPDNGGSHEKAQKLNWAIAEARRAHGEVA
jgi:hypothetical protein